MSVEVFAAVLFAACFQASWNFFTKKSTANRLALLLVGWFFTGLCLIPVVMIKRSYVGVEFHDARFLLGSSFVHAIYATLLGWAYSLGEMSVVFPVSRGLGIAGTGMLALALNLHPMSPAGVGGVLTVVCGTLLIGIRELPHHHRRHAFLMAIAVSITVTLYTLLDSRGVKEVPVLFYLTGLHILAPLAASPYLILKRRAELMRILRHHKGEALFVGVAGVIGYFIILWAYQRSATAYVATLREFSVVIAALLGIILLKEDASPKKMLGIALIIMGVIFLKFG